MAMSTTVLLVLVSGAPSLLFPLFVGQPHVPHNRIVCGPVKKINKPFPKFEHAVDVNGFLPNTKGICEHPYVFLKKAQRAYEVFEKHFVLFTFFRKFKIKIFEFLFGFLSF